MPDLDHGRGDQYLRPARGERRHRLLLLRRAHLAVHQHDLVVRERPRLEPLVLGGGRARLEHLGLLDQRADDERLAARIDLVANPGVRALPLSLGRADMRRDRLTAPRQLAQHRHVEVA